MKTFKSVLKAMPTCVYCLSRVKKFVFMKRLNKPETELFLCKTCKQKDPIMKELLSSHTEDRISDLLEKADIGTVFKCITRIKRQKYKNLAQFKLLLQLLLKKDFTQTLIDNVTDVPLVSVLLLYPTKIQWRKIHNNYTVLEFFLTSITDLGVIDLLIKKISNTPNDYNVLLPTSTEPPLYNSLNFQESSLPSAPIETISRRFSGKWLLLYNNN